MEPLHHFRFVAEEQPEIAHHRLGSMPWIALLNRATLPVLRKKCRLSAYRSSDSAGS